MAYSTAVINKKDELENIALKKDREAVALKMESYGIARACKITNNGNTKRLIIKAVMDKTTAKTDEHKRNSHKKFRRFRNEFN